MYSHTYNLLTSNTQTTICMCVRECVFVCVSIIQVLRPAIRNKNQIPNGFWEWMLRQYKKTVNTHI